MKNWKSDLNHAGGGILLSCILLLLASACADGSEPAGQTAQNSQTMAAIPPDEMAVALKEIPVWEIASERVRASFLRGQYAFVRPLQKGMVLPGKRPEFTSDAPLYGEVSFRGVAADSTKSGRLSFALDCSQKGGDYDLLYFDENGDADLTNDKPRKPAPESDRLARHSSSLMETYFEPLAVTFDFGAAGRQTLQLLPCLRAYGSSQRQFSFIAARVHTGEFEIGGTSYQAFLGYQNMISGRFDQPSTGLLLLPQDREPVTWWGGDQLNATHLLGGRYYRFTCTPAGDKLTVQPYVGALGVFEIGPGGRSIGAMTMAGSLRAAATAVAVGAETSDRRTSEPTRSCKLPVGDYCINDLLVQIDGLRALILNNCHANGKPMGKMGRQNAYGVALRADKPFVLEFSRKAQVLFALPAQNHRIRVGEELSVKAVLIDPALDVMFRVLSHGQQLDPKVTITRANGEIIAEGVMPFG